MTLTPLYRLTYLLALLTYLLTPKVMAETLNGHILELTPWGYKDSSGTISGRHPRLLEQLSNTTGITLNYELTPLKRLRGYLRNQHTDFSLLFLRDEYAAQVEVIAPVEDLSLYALYAKGSQADLAQVRRVGIILGETDIANSNLLNTLAPGYQVQEVASYIQLFKMLRSQRIDTALYTGDTFEKYLESEKIDRSNFGAKHLLEERKVYLLLNKHSANYNKSTATQLRQGITQLKLTGALEKINHTH